MLQPKGSGGHYAGNLYANPRARSPATVQQAKQATLHSCKSEHDIRDSSQVQQACSVCYNIKLKVRGLHASRIGLHSSDTELC